MQEKYEDAETFFEAATCEDEKSVLAWTTLGECIDNPTPPPPRSFVEPAETFRNLHFFLSSNRTVEKIVLWYGEGGLKFTVILNSDCNLNSCRLLKLTF